MGRAKKPAAVKHIEGNRSKVAIGKLKPDPAGVGRPHMPPALNATEEEMWLDTIESLPDGILSAADDGILERFVTAWARHREARIQLANTGILIRSKNGPVRNPLLVVVNQAAREMHAAGAELGLSPVARARLNGAEIPINDPMAYLMGGADEDEAEDEPRRTVN